MTIKKKSLKASLRPDPETTAETRRRAVSVAPLSEAQPAKQTGSSEDLTLSKRTVSRILLAKSLFGR